MCLPVSRLFWVSSLAYPNLLGTKGYVVVVVVHAEDREKKMGGPHKTIPIFGELIFAQTMPIFGWREYFDL
jgi:hypothetical protein